MPSRTIINGVCMSKRISKLALFVFFFILLLGITEIAEATTYHVSGDGSKDFIKIQEAANVAQPGDTIVVHTGTYRERVTPPRGGTSETQRITYMAAPGETVYIKGSEVWNPVWQQSGSVSFAKPDGSMFNDDVYVDSKNPFEVKMVESTMSLGQVFVDGIEYKQSTSGVVASTEKTWRYASGTIYIHFPGGNPAGHTTEITTRRSIFRPHIKGLQYITVKGFIMEHCGNNNQFAKEIVNDPDFNKPPQFPYNSSKPTYKIGWRTTHGALDAHGGGYWIIENNIVRYAKSVGIDVSGYTYTSDNERNDVGKTKASYNIVRNNIVMYNGIIGIGASMNYDKTGTGSQITGNWIEGNDYLHIKDIAEYGGIKTHYFNNGIIANNVIIGQYRHGIWMDQGWENNRVTGNLMFDNGKMESAKGAGADLYMEGYNTPIGKETVIDGNVMFGYLRFLDAQGLIISQNYIKGLEVYYGASGLGCPKDATTDRGSIGRLTITNNLFTVSQFDTDPRDGTISNAGLTNNVQIDCAGPTYSNKITNNVMGVTSFTRSVSGNAVTGTLTANNAPFLDASPLSSNKIVDDYFHNAYGVSIVKGPFQDLTMGANSYTLWPKNGVPPTTVSAPVFSPGQGTYTSPQSVSISTSTADATIHYTLDGTTDPTEISSTYSTPIPISSTKTIKAKAWKTGLTPSSVASATYTIGSAPTNQITLKPGWNQISSPIAAGVTLATIEASCTILPYKTYKLWAWNAQTQTWTNPAKVEPFRGHWIYAAYQCTVPLSGTAATFTSLQLYNGWNKISASGTFSAIQGTCAGHITGNWVWHWDKATEKWIHPTTMQLDKGYWIKVDQNCVLGG